MLTRARTENGLVEGLPAADPRVTSFKGIPYAAPPVGENRWRAPQPAKDWDGVLHAYRFAPISMQHRPGEDPEIIYTREWNVDPDIPMSEDCLYLNVWTPAKSAQEKLPVFIWFFGGALVEGNTAEMEFDGERIARRGIVVVTVNYRLNVFGFFCHPELTAESPQAPANFGHLDQQFAMRWVHRNIAAFGGNPGNVTLGGQSAGGSCVMSQLACPANEGLFHKAILDSGMVNSPYPDGFFAPALTLEQCEPEGVRFLEFLGVSSIREARELDAFFLRDKMLEYGHFWNPVVDGKFCLGPAFERIMEGKTPPVPLLLGHTAAEFPNTPQVRSVEEFRDYAARVFGKDAGRFLRLCDSSTGSISEMKHKATINHVEYSIRLLARAWTHSDGKPPLYYWLFDPEIPGWDNPGSFHSSDLWFFWETLAKCWRPFVGKHYDLARMMCNYWANFIRSADPNGKDADGKEMPRWEPFTEDSPWRIFFGDGVQPQLAAPDELMRFLLERNV